MRHRTIRGAAVSAVVLLLATTAIAFADTIPADGDQLTPGNQGMVSLGVFEPGEIVPASATFLLTCAGLNHALPGQTIRLQLSSLIVPLDGTATATPTTIGPVPLGWTAGGAGCPSPAPTLASNGPSIVTLKMPTTPGEGYIFTLMFARIGGTGLTGSSAVSFEVDVVANTPPVLSLPGPIGAEASGASGAAVSFTASAIDAEDDPDPIPTCNHASGETFALGVTTVSCSVTDSRGKSASGSFTVTVSDTTGPVLVLPADITAEATSSSGAGVTFSASASDVVDGDVSVSCDHASGDTFGLGTTTVSCSAVDTAKNPTSGSFDVTVSDTTAPVLVLPADISAEATSPSGAGVTFSASATDVVDGNVAVSCDPASGGTFGIGATTVSCSAVDTAGHPTSGSFQVTVADTQGPSLNGVPGNISVTTNNPTGRSVSYAMPTASDAADPNPTVGCTPASGAFFAVGSTRVNCTARDDRGQSASESFMVNVQFVADEPSVDWSVVWGEPIGGSPSVLVTNTSRTVPLKIRIFADGVEQKAGIARLRVVACGGDTALVLPLVWSSGRWAGHLDVSLLPPGCYVAVATLNGTHAGSFSLSVGGADPLKAKTGADAAAAATSAKDKSGKK